MDALFRPLIGDEFSGWVDEPLPPKLEVEGVTYVLAKGVRVRESKVIAIYEQAAPDDV